jgi:hypothetical protein
LNVLNVVELLHHHLELRSGSLPFGRTQASLVLRSLNHELLAVLDDDTLVVGVNLLTSEVVADSGLWRFLGEV